MLYPLKFHPILKEKIWGGNKLKTILHKKTTQENVGESWEISTVNEQISIVSNGQFEGKNLKELIEEFKGKILGERVYQEFGDQFPLLIKFIDAKTDLSVQLHPNDELAKKRHNSFGKTEMWYVAQADENAKLIIGFNKDTNKEEYEDFLNKGKITELLNFEEISEGDSYFINAGRIHAIGGGSLIAEIQQTSDITYRVYDWDRQDKEGNYRELHTDLALDALDFKAEDDFKLKYALEKNKVNQLISSKYFTTNTLSIDQSTERTYKDLDSFKILMCVRGKGEIKTNEITTTISLGETVLIPSRIDNLFLENVSNEMKLLEVYIK
ncbi:mannose-6-phosphate isomerase [Aquimarina sp. AD10]|uniref:type I phosphomannose isomerase catalytic subunit n=1 Tax=Aquimarina sp. AD10 TaxID=1714849 RepID=UPI000E4CAE3B|nr:type I phosphomannose isomerase catalytic subunit [Aquimarina sp. AD10]AXT61843.1 mannose-6-phosphate isomerase [Aquimarina sp. AD10]RKN02641.1 mannose-6-phosphate isomerase [Aquimarina sp. AD10]